MSGGYTHGAGLDMSVEGFRELEARIEEIGSLGAEKAIASAQKKALMPAMAAAKGLAPSDSGALRQSLAIWRARRDRNPDSVRSQMGPKTNKSALALWTAKYPKRAPRKGVFWGIFVERGHDVATKRTGKLTERQFINKRRYIVRKGKGTGHVEGRRFLERASTSTASEQVAQFQEWVGKCVDRIARRAGQKTADKSIGGQP